MKIKDFEINLPKISWKIMMPAAVVISLIIMSVIHLSNPGAAASFFEKSGVLKLLFNLIFITSIAALVFFSTARSSVAATVTIVLSTLFAVTSNTTYSITGKPLQPTDFLMAGELSSIVSFVDIKLGAWGIVMITLAFLAIVAAFLFAGVEREDFSLKIRLSGSGASVFLLIIYVWLFGFCQSFISVLPTMGISVSQDPGSDYLNNGAILCFLPKLSSDSGSYSAKDIAEIREIYGDVVSFEKTADVRPSIIAIQNEAWWDPQLIPDVKFNREVLPTYKSEMENLKAGYMVTPVFGGGTCIPEFEYLTGFSSVYLSPNSYPYIQSVNSKIPSVASALKDGGYETLAIHTYKTNFYGRKKAFPLLGFDKFIGTDDMEDPKFSGFYVSDEEMGDQIISAFENKKKDNIFIFGLTMQNHGNYTKRRYAYHDISVSSSALSNDDLKGLQDFTQGAYDADRLLLQLTEYFSKVDEPVLVLMYGDHLPLLGTAGSTYIDGGFIPDEGKFEFEHHEQLQKTPFAVWANYPIDAYDIPDEISPVGLSLLTVKAANLDSVPWHFKVIDDFNQKYPIYTPQIIKTREGEKVSIVADEDLESSYRLVQQDILSGNKYALKLK